MAREKEIRPEICNKIVENIANEIVSFKTGYLLGEPIQYVSRSDYDTSKEVGELNDIMELCNKPCVDNDIAEWLYDLQALGTGLFCQKQRCTDLQSGPGSF